MHDLNFKLVDKLVDLNDSLVVPDLDPAVLTSRSDEAKIVTIGTADDVFLMTFGLASLDHLALRLGRHNFVQVDLDGTIPTAGDDRMVVSTVADEGNFTIKGVMFFELKRADTRLQVVNLDLALMTTENQFSMMLIENHLRDLCCKYILDHSNRFAGSGVPDLDVLLTSDENLKAFLTK